MDTETEAKAKVVLKIYIRVLLYLNNNLNNNNINTFLTYLNDLVRQNKRRTYEDDEFKSLDHIYIESIANKNLLKYDEAECKKTELEAESPGTKPPGPKPPEPKPPKGAAQAEAALAEEADAAEAQAEVAKAAEGEAAQALAKAVAAQTEAEQALAKAKAAVEAAKVEAVEPQAGEPQAGEAVAAVEAGEAGAEVKKAVEVAEAKLIAARKAVEAATKAEAAAKKVAEVAAKKVAEVAAKAKAELTLNQKQIFTSFKLRLDAYNPPSGTKTYKYRDYGKTIDEKYEDKKNIIRTKRVKILIDTLKKFDAKIAGYYNQAKQNMLLWCNYVKPRDPKGLEVIVKEMDWGEMALECTKTYKSIFACLNMANAISPGGGYDHGPAAQEENMFRRTDCHFSIDRKSHLKGDGTYNIFMRDQISAATGTTYLDNLEPRICIKGKENGDGTPSQKNLLAIGPNLSKIGYDDLPDESKFLFYELRCAAVKIKKGETFDPVEMQKRIEAQFKTLKGAGVRHAILGAFGCGAFNNPPEQVAKLYKECLERYKNDFDVIAFPIYFAGSGPNNYPTFRAILLNNPDDENTTSIFYGAQGAPGQAPGAAAAPGADKAPGAAAAGAGAAAAAASGAAADATEAEARAKRPTWFSELFGFDDSEGTWEQKKNNFQMEDDWLVCTNTTAPPQFKKLFVGRFECPSLADLREIISRPPVPKGGGLSFEHLAAPGGVRPLHYDARNAGAVFQSASQFNCLEMQNSGVSPSAGISIYFYDKTQGPACAIACPAGTVYRNYLVKHGDYIGQHPVQIDNLNDVGVVVDNNGNNYWNMQNGYAMPTNSTSLALLAERLRVESELVDRAENALRVGVHWETSVMPPIKHSVCQVYASAVPCAYSLVPKSDWEPLARLVLRAAYKATLAVGAVLSNRTNKRVKCYLTALGDGAFGNEYEWIRDAILHALDEYREWPLDVVLVHYGSVVGARWSNDLEQRQPA